MKQQKDYASLAEQWQRHAEEKMTDTSTGPAVWGGGAKGVVLAPPAPTQLHQLPAAENIQQIEVMPAATVQTVVRTNQVDHSKGFLIRTLPLAAAFALAAVVVAVGLLAVPLVSMRTLVVIFVTFCAVYAWAFWQDLRTSPAGIALTHTQNLWKHIHEERKFKHEWYRDERKEIRRR